MAAVRCAIRRIGGSLLPRKQAAVVPSRLMRSRGLSSENACETEMHRLRSELDKKNEEVGRLRSALNKSNAELCRLRSAMENQSYQHAPKILKEDDSLAELEKTIREVEEYQKITRCEDVVKSLMVGSAKLAVFCIVVAAAFDAKRVEAKAVTKENQ